MVLVYCPVSGGWYATAIAIKVLVKQLPCLDPLSFTLHSLNAIMPDNGSEDNANGHPTEWVAHVADTPIFMKVPEGAASVTQ